MNWIKNINWRAWFSTLALIIIFRESAVALMSYFKHPELGNLVGLISLLIVLLLLRRFKSIPMHIVDTNNKIMRESAFAFLPICAGSLFTLVHMGKEIPIFVMILILSTLIPLWIYAKMAKRWL